MKVTYRWVGEDLLVHTEAKGLDRQVLLTAGGTYEIQPPNPAKLEHRGRRCTILSLTLGARQDFFSSTGKTVRVRYLDTGRQGRACPDDLVPIP